MTLAFFAIFTSPLVKIKQRRIVYEGILERLFGVNQGRYGMA